MLSRQLRRATRWSLRRVACKHTSTSFESFTKATWSVNDLLDTYPAPRLDIPTLTRLHKVSALAPPEPGSTAFKKLHSEIEQLVRLVEAVKLVDTSSVSADGRIWAIGRGIDLEVFQEEASTQSEQTGRALLKHASKTVDNLFVVEGVARTGS